jgi:hypothetical protein
MTNDKWKYLLQRNLKTITGTIASGSKIIHHKWQAPANFTGIK